MKKRILATVLCLCMVVCMLPTVAFAATGSSMQLGTGGIEAGDTVYYGVYDDGTTEYEVPWYALDTNGFLLSKYTIGTSIFREWEDYGYYNYSTVSNSADSSVLKETMDGLYDVTGTKLFSDLEQGAIKETALAGNSMYDSNTPNVNAHLFPLSLAEADTIGWSNDILKAPSITAPEVSAGWWWLRSSTYYNIAFCVFEDGNIHTWRYRRYPRCPSRF